MAAPNPANIVFAGPGTLTFGGTAIGLLRGMSFRPERTVTRVWAEEWGCYVDEMSNGERVIFRGILRYPDANAIADICDPGTFSFTVKQTNCPGTPLYGDGQALVYTPASANFPTLTVYNAIPAVDEAAELQMSVSKEYGLAVAFHGTPNGSGQVYAWH